MDAHHRSMLLIAVPTAEIAKTLVDVFALKRELRVKTHPLYANDEMALIVTGTGALASAIGTTTALAKVPYHGALSIGFASGNENFAEQVILAHAITDPLSKRSVYPDMILKHALLEQRVISTMHSGDQKAGIYDGEAFAFYEAASTFLSPSRIACLRVVVSESKDALPALAKEKIVSYIRSFAAMVQGFANEGHAHLTEQEQLLLAKVAVALRLTAAQREKLHQLALRHRLRIPTLAHFLAAVIRTSHDRAQIFKQIEEELRVTE